MPHSQHCCLRDSMRRADGFLIPARVSSRKTILTPRTGGGYKKTDRCVIIDDVITTGKSIEDIINILKDEVNIVDISVVFNRQQNHECSLPVKSLLYKNDVIKYRLNFNHINLIPACGTGNSSGSKPAESR